MELQEKTPRQALLDAFAERDRVATKEIRPKYRHPKTGMLVEGEPEGLKDAEHALLQAMQAYTHDENFDPQTEPVMAQVLEGAKRCNPSAMRMLLQPRVRVRLAGPPAGKLPEPDAFVGVNEFSVTVPRGKTCTVPEIVAEILEQSGIA